MPQLTNEIRIPSTEEIVIDIIKERSLPKIVKNARICANCAAWRRIDAEPYGECRLNPPQIIDKEHLTKHGPLCKFILTSENTSCYRFKKSS